MIKFMIFLNFLRFLLQIKFQKFRIAAHFFLLVKFLSNYRDSIKVRSIFFIRINLAGSVGNLQILIVYSDKKPEIIKIYQQLGDRFIYNENQ